MLISFFDEFGHAGPFVSRADKRYNHSPVFGLAGYVLPHQQVRHFATFFFQLKNHMLAHDLKAISDHPATWEKKGTDLITTRNIEKYRNIREGLLRLLNEIYKCRGKIIYYGREKYQEPQEANASGLYTTVMAHTIRAVDSYCCTISGKFMMILDQHSDRIRLLESAAKTMFSSENPARCLLEPPFQVESHLYQTIQAADWVATLIGRWAAYHNKNDQYADWEWTEKYFGDKLRSLSTHSTLWRPSKASRDKQDITS